jgi:hypothetical protein
MITALPSVVDFLGCYRVLTSPPSGPVLSGVEGPVLSGVEGFVNACRQLEAPVVVAGHWLYCDDCVPIQRAVDVGETVFAVFVFYLGRDPSFVYHKQQEFTRCVSVERIGDL